MTTNFTENHERASGLLAGARVGIDGNTDEERARAARHVASNAHDAADCRGLLEALGLLDPGFAWVQIGHGRRRKVQS